MPAVPAPVMATSTSRMARFIRQPWLTTMVWHISVFPVNEGAANDDASFVSELHSDTVRSIVAYRKRAGTL